MAVQVSDKSKKYYDLLSRSEKLTKFLLSDEKKKFTKLYEYQSVLTGFQRNRSMKTVFDDEPQRKRMIDGLQSAVEICTKIDESLSKKQKRIDRRKLIKKSSILTLTL